MRTSLVFIIGIIFFAVLGGYVDAQDTPYSPSLAFHKAGVEYQEGEYQQAIEGYEMLLDNGSVNGAVYFNLANSYYKNGQYGLAILNYERAKQYLPHDSDLIFNYQHTLQKIKNNTSLEKKNLLVKVRNRYESLFSLDHMAVILLIFILVLGVFHLTSLYMTWPKKVILRIMTIGLVLFACHLYFFLSISHMQKSAGIVLNDSESRFEPISSATAHFRLYEGGKVFIVKEKGVWVKIKRPDGRIGWVESEHIGKI